MILTSVYFVFKLIKDIYILVFSFFIVFYKQKTVIPLSYLPTMDFFKTAIKKKWDTKVVFFFFFNHTLQILQLSCFTGPIS